MPSAAPAAAVAAAPVEEVAAPKEKSVFNVNLTKIDATQKAKAIREVKAIMPSMNLVEVRPHFVHLYEIVVIDVKVSHRQRSLSSRCPRFSRKERRRKRRRNSRRRSKRLELRSLSINAINLLQQQRSHRQRERKQDDDSK